MKTLARESCRTELARRLSTLGPASTRRWGRMSAHQMVCHLTDSCRVMTGEKSVSSVSTLPNRTLVKWIALYLPVPWPAGIQTRPEVDQRFGGTRPVEFTADVAKLQAIMNTIATREMDAQWAPHPIFGRMSRAAWLRWAYLHTDHHLRQFGA